MKQLRNLTLLLLILAPLPALAQDDPAWFDIELLVFSQDQPGSSSEQWPEAPGKPDLERSVRLRPPSQGEGGSPVAYSLLPRDGLRLQAEFDQLNRGGGYTPLLHQAWRQPVLGNSDARPIYLSASPRRGAAPALEGTVRISVNRYLHVELDLLLQDSRAPSLLSGIMNMVNSQQPAYRMQERRRMRSGSLHYLDHPKMGALVLISRYEPPKPEPEPAPAPATESAPGNDKATSAPQSPSAPAKPPTN